MNEKIREAMKAGREEKANAKNVVVECHGRDGLQRAFSSCRPRAKASDLAQVYYTGKIDLVGNVPESGYVCKEPDGLPAIQIFPIPLSSDEQETCINKTRSEHEWIIDSTCGPDVTRIIKAGYDCEELRVNSDGRIIGGVWIAPENAISFRTKEKES